MCVQGLSPVPIYNATQPSKIPTKGEKLGLPAGVDAMPWDRTHAPVPFAMPDPESVVISLFQEEEREGVEKVTERVRTMSVDDLSKLSADDC
jgi:hypothetical protein